MIEQARDAIRKLGPRSGVLGTCPICGRKVKDGDGHVRAWSGTYAHNRCASYERAGRRRLSLRRRERNPQHVRHA